jgi:hypothetical protein
MNTLRSNRALSTLLVAAIIVIVVIAVVLGAFLFFAFSAGNQKTQTYSNTDFSSVIIGSAFKVNITQSDTYSISISAGERIFDRIEVTQSGNTLTIGLKPGLFFGSFNLQAQITMPKLDSVEFSGATHGTTAGFSSTDSFTAKVSGASYLEMTNFQSGNITADVSGASTFTASGTAGDLSSSVSGASHLNLLNLQVNNAKLDISGASQAEVNVSGRLDADINGASHVDYTGSPTLGTINTSGASSINKK